MGYCRWTFKFTPEAEKKFEKLDKPVKTKIQKKIDKMLQGQDSVMNALHPLVHQMSGLYSLHIGEYRLICEIKETALIILGVDVGHRKHIYGGH